MSGPQFAHIQTWSRKPNPRGQSIEQIIAEALREAEFCAHVEDPQPPRILVGDPSSFRADHDEHVGARATSVMMKDGSERSRAIRQDRHTMASIVMSYPVPRSAITTDAAREKYAAWERRNVEWLRETYGDQLRVVMAHDDEEHGHLHAWLLPDDPGADATVLHPGKVAKKAAEADAKAAGLAPREAVKIGNRVLKAAMTEWQDDYYRAVGAPEGLTRTGPKRRRLNREQWKATKAAARVTAEVAAEAQAQADKIMAEAEAVATGVRSLAQEVEAGTIYQGSDGRVIARDAAALRPALSVLAPAIRSAAAARTKLDRDIADIAGEQRLAEAQRREMEARAAVLDARSYDLDKREVDLDHRAGAISAREKRLDSFVERLKQGLAVVNAGFRLISEKLGVSISDKFHDALDDVQAALDEYRNKPSKMRIAPASDAPEDPREEADGLGF